MQRYERILDAVIDGAAWLARALLMFQVVTITAGVILRYAAGISFSWLNSLNEWTLLWVAFLGAAWLERENGHVSVDTFIEAAGENAVRWAKSFAWLLGLACCAVLLWYGGVVTYDKMANDVYDFFKIRDFPVYPIYAVMPFGFLLWLLQILRQARRHTSKTPPDLAI
jgi:TRAP-type C4-dicarboxylate transport system permease small subunit